MDLPISLDLKDRTLWFDGASTVSTSILAKMILEGIDTSNIFPEEIDSDIKKFNKYSTDRKFELKDNIGGLNTDYIIPQQYLDINLEVYFYSLLEQHISTHDFTELQVEERITRVKTELSLFKQYNIENLIRTAIYIVDVFEEHSVVWGTGRGSSCACYCLYLLGLHEVDSVKYNLELDEFFR